MKKVKKINDKLISIEFRIKDKDEFNDIKNKVKTILGRKWINSRKIWTAPITKVTILQLKKWGFEIEFDLKLQYIDKKKIKSKKNNIKKRIKQLNIPFFKYQEEGIIGIEKFNGIVLLADEMGCIDGEAVIQINRGGGSKKLKLKDVYKRFHQKDKKNYNFDLKIKTNIRCLKKDRFGLNQMKNIIYKGKKQVLEIKTESGKKLKLTPDHKVLSSEYNWKEIQNFNVGDYIIVNGKDICKKCGSSENIINYKYAKFKGFCKSCMYEHLRINKNTSEKIIRRKGKDGYIYLKGELVKHHHRKSTSGVLEHIYIMEKHLGIKINKNKYQVHHKNKNRSDNRIENLELLTKKEHAKIHKCERNFKNFIHKNGNEIITIPKKEKIIKIEISDFIDVYDIIMEDPYRNFVANGIVVHNCGKTIQAIGWCALHPEFEKILVIVPASLKLNWRKEFKKWVNEDCYIINGKKEKLTEVKSKILIINYEILEAYEKYFKQIKINALILDECHYIKNSQKDKKTKKYKTKRTNAVHEIRKKIPHVLALSGTPITNRPLEIFSVLNLLRKDLFSSRWRFARRYCDAKHNGFGWDYSGASHISELNKILKETLMIRRLKKDVHLDLPEKLPLAIVYVQLPNMKEYIQARDNFATWYFEENEEKKPAEALVKMEQLKQLIIQGKKYLILEWIDNFLESGKKLIVFATHHEILDFLFEKYESIAVKVDGRTKNHMRQTYVDLFQNNSNIKIFFGNIQAAGVGITLTAASDTLHVELPWTPGELDQNIDRVHRIGQKEPITPWFLIAENTIEKDIMNMLDKKRKVLNNVLDGKEIKENNFFKEILKNFKKV
jgi:SWI/SNF-related matrix-associated actin-dependent regulator 1 of chromatin subfamily A